MKDRYALQAEAPRRFYTAVFVLRRGEFEEHLNQRRRLVTIFAEPITVEQEARLAIESDGYVWSLPGAKEER